MKHFIFKVTVTLPNSSKEVFHVCDDNISSVPYHFTQVTWNGKPVDKYISSIERVDEFNIIGYGENYEIPYKKEH